MQYALSNIILRLVQGFCPPKIKIVQIPDGFHLNIFSGFGGLGPIVEGPIVGWIADKYGWTGPFYLMVAMSLLGSVTMLKASKIDQSIKKAQFMGSLGSEDA